jgi:hypothetical protein
MAFQQITPEATTAFLVGSYLFGVTLRVLWPFILAYLNEGVKFDWRYAIGQVVAAVIGLFGVMAAEGFVVELGLLGFFGAFVLGFGAASVGRNGQKTIDAARGK